MDTLIASANQNLLSLEGRSHEPVREQLLMLDSRLRVIAASPSFYNTFQLAPDRTIGKELIELGEGEWGTPAILALLNELPGTDEDSKHLEVEQDLPALGPRRLQLSGRRLPGRDAKSGMILLSIRDATEQKRNEDQAGELPTGFQVSLATLGYAIIITDPENRVRFMNSTAETLTGWSQNDAWQKQLTEVFNVVSEQSSQTLESPIAKAIHQGGMVGLEKYALLVGRDGREWPIDGNAVPILEAGGDLGGAVLAFHDIGDRRKAERKTEISEVRYRRLFEAAHDGILLLDATTVRVLDVNPFLIDLLGYPKEHFIGKELWEIGVLSDAETSKSVMATLQRHGRIRYEDLPLQTKDGRHIPVEFVSNVYPEGRKNVIQCNIRDMSERKRVAQSLAKARRDAEAANRSKSEFLANMSHEIRTPMGAILGFADMLLHRSPEECALIGCVQIIQRNSLHLLELVDDILDLSKVEAGQMKVERIACDLPHLISGVISLMRPRAAEKKLTFGVTFQGPIPRLIQSDPLRLRQILVNLLGNAVKFTESGRIDLRIMDEGVGGPDIVLRLDVIDSGIGMTPEQLGQLFKPFAQADASVTRKFGGTGLGLTISRQLARLLGGDVVATSQPGIGSTFTLTVNGGSSSGVEQLHDLIEATLPARVEQKAKAAIHLHGHILLVEDGADNQRLLGMELSDAGASVTSALDGQIAVDLATSRTFDLILMDMQMPVMDGYAATLELRRRGLTIPIIAVTASAMVEDREKCLASGCTAFLTKPLQEETLLRTVSQYLQNGHLLADGKSAGLSSNIIPSARIESSLAGNPRIMLIIPEFVAGLPVKVHNLLGLLASQNLAGLQVISHQLLGSCGGYGFQAISDPARKVEESIKAGRSVESITPEVNSLIDVLRRIDGYDESKENVALEELVK